MCAESSTALVHPGGLGGPSEDKFGLLGMLELTRVSRFHTRVHGISHIVVVGVICRDDRSWRPTLGEVVGHDRVRRAPQAGATSGKAVPDAACRRRVVGELCVVARSG